MKPLHYVLICCLLGLGCSKQNADSLGTKNDVDSEELTKEEQAIEKEVERMVEEMFRELDEGIDKALKELEGDTITCEEVQISCTVTEKVFTNKKEYRQNTEHSVGCIANIGYIDFEKHSLIGVGYSSASRAILECELIYNASSKTYYHIADVTQYGNLYNMVVLKHWCVIPQLQEDQKVIFMKFDWYKELGEYPQED